MPWEKMKDHVDSRMSNSVTTLKLKQLWHLEDTNLMEEQLGLISLNLREEVAVAEAAAEEEAIAAVVEVLVIEVAEVEASVAEEAAAEAAAVVAEEALTEELAEAEDPSPHSQAPESCYEQGSHSSYFGEYIF